MKLVVTDTDASQPVELLDAQIPAVLDYQPADSAVIQTAVESNQSLKQRAVRSSLWTLTAFAAGQLIRFVSNPVLAYLLEPAYFGIVSLVSVFITGLAAMSDVGVEQAIIQNKRGDEPVFLNTAFTVHAVRGIFLWLGACAMAWPVYWFYNDPNSSNAAYAKYLLWMLPVAGLAPVLTGFNSTATFTLNRHLQMGRLTIVNLAYQVVSVIVMLAIAWKWRTPWALVLGGIAANVFYLIVSHTMIKGYRNRFCWDLGVRRELMKFGKWILVSTLITYAANQIDRPMLGKIADVKWLGLYGIAFGLVLLPREIIGRLASVTLFPTLSRTAEARPADLPRVFNRARGLIMTASVAATVGVVLGAPIFITVFYRREYHQAGWLTQLASIGGWFVLLQTTADRALLALGKTRPLAVSNAVNLTVTVGASLLGMHIETHFLHHTMGLTGFMLGLALGKMVGHLMIQIEMAREGMSIYRQDLLYSALLLGLSVAGMLLPGVIDRYHPGHEFLHEAVVAIALCVLTSAWAGRRLLRGIR